MKRIPLLKKSLELFLFIFLHNTVAFAQSSNPYLAEVNIPPYDSSNTEHFLITTINAGWSYINDTTYRFFYVAPGDYRSLSDVIITADGTENAPRYISLMNGNDIHPGKLPVEEQANVKLVFQGANYWIVDRISSINVPDVDPIWDNGIEIYVCAFLNGSTNNILNRMLFSNNNGVAVEIRGASHNNIIQNCRIEKMPIETAKYDVDYIRLLGELNTPVIKNTRIVNNEFSNGSGGIILFRAKNNEVHGFNYEGTIISGNHFYIDSTLYTNGNGIPDPNGYYAFAENGIDLKAGSLNPDNPIIISDNYLWGFRKSDETRTKLGDWGTALVGHFGAPNIRITNNVIFNSARGIHFNRKKAYQYSAHSIFVADNIFESVGSPDPSISPIVGFYWQTKDVTFVHNVLAGTRRPGEWLKLDGSEDDFIVATNVIIDMNPMTGTRNPGSRIEDNWFYNTQPQEPGDGNVYNSAGDARMEALSFVTDRFTNNPRTITVPGVVSTGISPHAAYFSDSPYIVIQPENQEVTEGKTATFEVLAGGKDPLTYQWKKNGIDIPGAVANKYMPPPATPGDDGAVFSVVITNDVGATISKGAMLTVKELVTGLRNGGTSSSVLDFKVYPTPSRDNRIHIEYNIPEFMPERSLVKINIFNLNGMAVDMIKERQGKGQHVIEWNGKDQQGNKLSKGFYIFIINVKDMVDTCKVYMTN